jgi:hypothetical protein
MRLNLSKMCEGSGSGREKGMGRLQQKDAGAEGQVRRKGKSAVSSDGFLAGIFMASTLIRAVTGQLGWFVSCERV